ncbi:hypothetical protein V8C42DRAFT_363113 [Trichoderma barbatum]
MSTVESLDDSLTCFFSDVGACTTRSQCDAFAIETFGGPIIPTTPQGLSSYSVSAANGTVLVQFKDAASPINTELLDTVQTIHADVVVWVQTLGDGWLIGGFFAQSWSSGKSLELELDSAVFQDYCSSFESLTNSLPTAFHDTASHVQRYLPEIFSRKYPLVITHGDIREANVLADPETGEITGIIDWAEAGVLPFGFSLYGLDHFLGYMMLTGWVLYENAKLLRDEFWKVFCEMAGGVSESEMKLIMVARTAGLLLRYGSKRPGRKGVVGVEGSEITLKILEALVPVHSLAEVVDGADVEEATV